MRDQDVSLIEPEIVETDKVLNGLFGRFELVDILQPLAFNLSYLKDRSRRFLIAFYYQLKIYFH